MVPITGTVVPTKRSEIRRYFASAVASALKEELGQSARATKTIMQWTGVSERAAKYWLAGSRAPSGWQLILLIRHSDAILQTVFRMSGRDLLEISIELEAAEAALGRATTLIRALRER